MYFGVMRVTITEFRKNLFHLVDRALAGEAIEFSHRGRTVRLAPETPPSRLNRLKPRKIFAGPPDQLEKATAEINRLMKKEWEKDWSELG